MKKYYEMRSPGYWGDSSVDNLLADLYSSFPVTDGLGIPVFVYDDKGEEIAVAEIQEVSVEELFQTLCKDYGTGLYEKFYEVKKIEELDEKDIAKIIYES